MRSVLELILRLVLRVFFRRITWVGIERIPPRSPVIFALNHHNGLIDPLLLLTGSPRIVCFLAKEPIFKTPIVGWVARKLDAIPVYRAQDDRTSMDKNLKTFQVARTRLVQGKAIAVFPEGVSHSEPRLKPLKTGAARIALGSRLESLQILPGAVIYDDKMTFRSHALIYLGPPIAVPMIAENEETSRLAIRQLTEAMKTHLEAAHREASKLLENDQKSQRPQTSHRVLKMSLLALPASIGALSHYPVYRLTGFLATRLSKSEDDLIATFKVLSSMLFFPLTWIGIGTAIGIHYGFAAGIGATLVLPILGLAALRFTELRAEK